MAEISYKRHRFPAEVIHQAAKPYFRFTLSLGYDMIGVDLFYADQGVQRSSDESSAHAIVELVVRRHLARILPSQGVFQKMMLTRYGGFGYAYLLRHFLPRLRQHGVPEAALTRMMFGHPLSAFDAAAA